LALAVLGGLLGHEHVKNRVFERRGGTWETGYATLRDGLVDWPGTVRALDAAGYDGWLTIDHLSDGPSALRRDVEELRGMVAPPAPRPDRRPIDRPRQRGRP
jgi:sugar phosphate isomerase/epimerase